MNEKTDCPECLGSKAVTTDPRKEPKECKFCKGTGTIDAELYDTFISQKIPSMNLL